MTAAAAEGPGVPYLLEQLGQLVGARVELVHVPGAGAANRWMVRAGWEDHELGRGAAALDALRAAFEEHVRVTFNRPRPMPEPLVVRSMPLVFRSDDPLQPSPQPAPVDRDDPPPGRTCGGCGFWVPVYPSGQLHEHVRRWLSLDDGADVQEPCPGAGPMRPQPAQPKLPDQARTSSPNWSARSAVDQRTGRVCAGCGEWVHLDPFGRLQTHKRWTAGRGGAEGPHFELCPGVR